MKVYWDVDFYILKPEITEKQQSRNFRKTQKTTTYRKPKKAEYRNISKMGLSFCIYLSGGSFAPL